MRLSILLTAFLLCLAGCKGHDENAPRLTLEAVHGATPKHAGTVAGRKYFAYELTDAFEEVRKSVAAQVSKDGWNVKEGSSSFTGPGDGKSVEFVAVKRGRLTSDGLNVISGNSHTVVTIYEPVGQ